MLASAVVRMTSLARDQPFLLVVTLLSPLSTSLLKLFYVGLTGILGSEFLGERTCVLKLPGDVKLDESHLLNFLF